MKFWKKGLQGMQNHEKIYLSGNQTIRLEGGLRIKGLFHKKSRPGYPFISIITVVRNGEKHLEQTIQSVLNQNYENIEYIVIDGASTDRTLDIIRKYEDKIAYWLSESDRGLFDAMNKGSTIASGDYALYLNSGDYLYCSSAITDIVRKGIDGDKYPLLIVGRVRFSFNNELLNWFWPISESKIYKYGIPHQGVLVGKPIYKKIFYNTTLKVGSDTFFWEQLQQQGIFQFKYVETVISVFRLGGISNSNKVKYSDFIREYVIRYKYNTFTLIKKIVYYTCKRILMNILNEETYYKYILYSIYLFRKRFL